MAIIRDITHRSLEQYAEVSSLANFLGLDITHRSLELLVWEWIFEQFSSLDILHRSLEQFILALMPLMIV
jgi:hypothetical protein